jgi:hypothetical protein
MMKTHNRAKIEGSSTQVEITLMMALRLLAQRATQEAHDLAEERHRGAYRTHDVRNARALRFEVEGGSPKGTSGRGSRATQLPGKAARAVARLRSGLIICAPAQWFHPS